ncbi:hypothetical protein [Paraburkholderia elongata]|uniref:hypothetical protein n=1 Tax=Paraburkholderia elongata TaxID=2675747 RepID=UPI001556B854|nr:hypothetical protein [Paraburkholderia elongata]
MLDAALKAGAILSRRLYRDERGWRAFVSFDHRPAEVSTPDAKYGVIGVDFNADHRAVTETDAFGNLLRTKRFALLPEYAGSGLWRDKQDENVAARNASMTAIIAYDLNSYEKLPTLFPYNLQPHMCHPFTAPVPFRQPLLRNWPGTSPRKEDNRYASACLHRNKADPTLHESFRDSVRSREARKP